MGAHHKAKIITFKLSSLTLLLILALLHNANILFGQTPPVVVNSYRDSNFDIEEWTELIVTQDNVDLRGFTIRDNSSGGNWQPFVRFKNHDVWNNLRRGTIIVLFHRTPTNSTFSNQLNPNKHDGHIAFSLENTTYFEYELGGSISMTSMSLSATSDMVQVRNAPGAHVHALGHRQDTTVNFAYWTDLSRPKLNHRQPLSQGEALMVNQLEPPNINQFGFTGLINGNVQTTKGLKNLPGFPNGGNSSANGTFWRTLREPDWISPSLTAIYNSQTNQVSLSWNAMVDAYPSDNVQGYMVLRSTTNTFQPPQDGVVYGIGNMLENAIAIGLINGTNNITFTDNLLGVPPIPCGGQYYYRIYAYRYGPDDIDQGSGPARGRAYNENFYASASAANPVPSTAISINSSAQNVTTGTQVTFTATINNPGTNPIITWYVNGVAQQTGSSTTFNWTFNSSATVTASLQSSLTCATTNLSNAVMITVTANPCNPGIISGPALLCLNQTGNYQSTGTPGGIWTSSNPSVATINTSGFVQTYASGTTILTYTVDNSSCTGTNFSTYTITVNPPPDAGPDQQLCNTKTANLQANAPHSGQGFWLTVEMPPGTLEFPIFANGIYSPNNLVSVPEYGTYIFSWSIEGCNTDLVSITFSPLETLTLDLSPTNPEVCPGQRISFVATPSHTASNNSFQWYRNGQPTGTNSSTYTLTAPTNGDQIAVQYQTNAFCLSQPQVSAGPVVISVLPAAITPSSAAASVTQVCSGSTETIALTAFGGSGSEIRWYSGGCGGTPIGSGTDIEIPAPQQTTTYYVRWETPGCDVSECKSVTITVLPTVQPEVSIVANKTNICENESVTFTAAPVNGGSSPVYQWFKNGNLTGDNAPVFSGEGWQPGDQVRCVLTSSAQCANPSQATSNQISLTVNPLIIPTLRIGSNATEVCQGSTVTFIIIEISGQGNNPQYQWFVNGSPASGATGNSFSLPVFADMNVYCRLASSETCASVPFENSNVIQVTVMQQVEPLISISSSQTQVCQSESVTFNANASGGGNSPGYQWRRNGIAINGATQPTYMLINPVNGDAIDCIFTSSAPCASQPTVTSNAVTLQVIPNLPVSASIQAAQYNGPVCQGTSLTFMANAVNGGQSPSYQWFVNGNLTGNEPELIYLFDQPGTFLVNLALNSSLSCSSGNPATSNTIEINVLPNLTVSVQLQASQLAACENTSIQLTAQAQNAGQNPSYEWFRNGQLYSSTLINQLQINALPGDQWSVRLSSSEQCAINSPALSELISLQIDPLAIAPQSVTASTTQLCLNSAGNITLTAQGGSGQQLLWYSGSCGANPMGTGNPLTISAPQQSTAYFAQYVSGLCPPSACADVSVTVYDLIVPQVQIAASSNQLCQGETASFSVQSQSGQGIAPSYDWLVNGISQGINSPNFSYQPANGDQVQCQLTSSEACAQPAIVVSTPVQMTVSQPLQPQASIQPLQDSVCFTEPIIISSNFINAGSNPTYQWMVNNIHNGQVNQTFNWYAPTPGTYQINLLATSSLSCVTSPMAFSPVVNITVLPLVQPVININTPTNTLCSGELANVSATFSHQGQQPLFQWFKNGQAVSGANNYILSFIPADGDVVYCQMTSSERCANPETVSSNSLTFNVSGIVQPTAQVQTQNNSVCQGNQATFNAVFSGGGNQPSVEWFVNNIAQYNGTSFTYVPQNTDKVYFRLNSSLSCAQPQAVFSDTITMQVNTLLAPSVTIQASANGICEGTPVSITANPVNGGNDPQYAWYVNGVQQSAGAASFHYTPANQDVVNCIMYSSEQCLSSPSASSPPLTFDVTSTFQPSVIIQTAQQQYCEDETVVVSAQLNQTGPSDVFQWFLNGQPLGTNSNSIQFTAAVNQQVSCLLTSSVACASPQQVNSEPVTINTLPVLIPAISISASQQEVCQGTAIDFEANWQNGGDNPGFQWLVNGQILSNQPLFSYTPSDDDQVQCRLISDYACANPSMVGSENVLMRVSENLGLTLEKTNAGCNGGTGTITATGLQGKPPYRFKLEGLTDWQDEGLFINLQPGNYTVLIKDLFGCLSNENAVIESEPGPVIIEIQHIPASNGFNNAILKVLAQGPAPLQYSLDGTAWQSNQEFNGLPAGPVTIFVRDANGCIVQQTLIIEALAVNISAGQDAGCQGKVLNIPISTDGFAAATRIILEIKYDDRLLQLSSFNQLSAYLQSASLSLTNQTGLVRLTLEKADGMSMPGGGLMMNLTFNTLTSGTSILKWEPVSLIQTQHQAAVGANFLSGSATVWPVPQINLPATIRSCISNPLEINPIIEGTPQSLLWTLPGGGTSTQPNLLFDNPAWTLQGDYSLLVTNEFGCTNTGQTEVVLLPCDLELPIPNAFSPGSAIVENRVFKPYFGPLVPPTYHLQIYNRWGTLVFETRDYQEGWDGRFKGQDAPAGVYVWKIRYTSEGESVLLDKTKSGTLTLIR